jgi:hypothetical protein
MALPQYKHGRYSKYLPRKVLPAYEEALADGELLSLREEAALLTARVAELLKRLEKSPPPPWKEALRAAARIKAAWPGWEGESELAEAFAELDRIVSSGTDAARTSEKTWRELRGVIADKTRTVAAEWKRLCDLKAVLTVEQVMLFVGAILGAARELTDPETFRRLNDRALALMPPEPR